MKLVQTVVLMIFAAQVAAEDLCPVNEDIEPDMRMTESHFTKENAEAAANKIKGIISGVDKKYEWFTVICTSNSGHFTKQCSSIQNSLG